MGRLTRFFVPVPRSLRAREILELAVDRGLAIGDQPTRIEAPYDREHDWALGDGHAPVFEPAEHPDRLAVVADARGCRGLDVERDPVQVMTGRRVVR